MTSTQPSTPTSVTQATTTTRPAPAPRLGDALPERLRDRLRRKISEFLWPLIWMALLATAAGVSLRAVSVMTQNPPLPDCTQLAAAKSDSEQLLCAQASVRSGSAQALVEAIELVEPWTPSNPLYEEANQLMNRWARALLSELELMVQRGDVQQARLLAGRIPTRVEIYPQVKSAIALGIKNGAQAKSLRPTFYVPLRPKTGQVLAGAYRHSKY
ncbi:MAG: hypothetical protein HC800_00525 [Phormidesmis sp. RL_2_1]|nr:hypothetical protein [Phormidesmis sp. RL_2_1]